MQYATKDSGERVEFESGMVRDTARGKTLWHLVTSGPMLRRWAELLTRGAEKYTPDNWTKANGVEEAERFKQSAFRHFMQWYEGERDEDHAAAVFFNINGAEYVEERFDHRQYEEAPRTGSVHRVENDYKAKDCVICNAVERTDIEDGVA